MSFNPYKQIIRPIIVPVLAFIIAVAIIVSIGETLLHLHTDDYSSEFARKELWFGVLLGLVFLGLGAFFSTRKGGNGLLDREVVIGSKPMFTPPASHATPAAADPRSGSRGTVHDITEGYTLLAQSGEYATVIGLIAGGEEAGRSFKGYIYARGVRVEKPELWIPIEAVLDVYPATRSAFLAVKGDETEDFGWAAAPESFDATKVVKTLPKPQP